MKFLFAYCLGGPGEGGGGARRRPLTAPCLESCKRSLFRPQSCRPTKRRFPNPVRTTWEVEEASFTTCEVGSLPLHTHLIFTKSKGEQPITVDRVARCGRSQLTSYLKLAPYSRSSEVRSISTYLLLNVHPLFKELRGVVDLNLPLT